MFKGESFQIKLVSVLLKLNIFSKRINKSNYNSRITLTL